MAAVVMNILKTPIMMTPIPTKVLILSMTLMLIMMAVIVIVMVILVQRRAALPFAKGISVVFRMGTVRWQGSASGRGKQHVLQYGQHRPVIPAPAIYAVRKSRIQGA